MKRVYLLICFGLFALPSFARDGYRIQLKLTDRKDSVVYLARYYGSSFPKIFKADSAKLDKHGNAVFDHKEKIVGGIYLILPSDRKSYFELLLDNGDDFSVTATMDDLRGNIRFRNTSLNQDFIAYQNFLSTLSDREKDGKQKLATAVTKEDSTAITDERRAAGKELITYRRNYVKTHPGTLLASIFNALETPQVPEGKHYKDDGTEDSSFAYRYYKTHYWDGFDFRDDRLIHTPILQGKLDEYFNKVVFQQEDSVIIEADTILSRVRNSENLFKYTLNWLSTNSQTSKVMGMDKVFVHLVDNYYMKGDATWLTKEELSKYIDRAKKIAPNVINNPAPPIKALDMERKEHSLYDFQAKYTLLIFYSADCGHCQHELPLIDSVYKAGLKDKGVRVIAFNVDSEEDKWRSFITRNHIEEWLNVWDPEHRSRYWALYDTQLIPAIYLLDEQKIIRGKKLNHSNIGRVIEITEYKERSARK